MIEREVTKTRKGPDGEILALCNRGQYWSPRSKESAIDDIGEGKYLYFVSWPEKKTEIRVVNGPTGKYLRTDRDDTSRNNLDDLPEC